jgi:nitrogen regulatory protein PII
MDTAKVRVVTIVATAELQERLQKDLWSLGARGLTVGKVSGWGAHGHRRDSFLDSGNVRIETLVEATIATKILERVVKNYDGQEIIAYVHDVEAVPKAHFE